MSANRGIFYGLSIACGLIILIAALPVVSVMLTYAVASVLGCSVSEAGPSPCPFLGVDLGETLVFTMMLGWLGLISIPLGGIAAAVWLVAWVVHRRQRRYQT